MSLGMIAESRGRGCCLNGVMRQKISLNRKCLPLLQRPHTIFIDHYKADAAASDRLVLSL